MTEKAKTAPQPLTVALTRLVASCPRRKAPDKYLGMYFYMNASLAILETPALLTDELEQLVARALEAARHRSEELGDLLGGQP